MRTKRNNARTAAAFGMDARISCDPTLRPLQPPYDLIELLDFAVADMQHAAFAAMFDIDDETERVREMAL
jgi:hypothetical protein